MDFLSFWSVMRLSDRLQHFRSSGIVFLSQPDASDRWESPRKIKEVFHLFLPCCFHTGSGFRCKKILASLFLFAYRRKNGQRVSIICDHTVHQTQPAHVYAGSGRRSRYDHINIPSDDVRMVTRILSSEEKAALPTPTASHQQKSSLKFSA